MKRSKLIAVVGLGAVLAAGALSTDTGQPAEAYTGPFGTVTAATATFTMPYENIMTPTMETAIADAFADGSLKKFSSSQDQPTISDVLAAANRILYWKADPQCDGERSAITPLDATHSVGAWCWENSDQEGTRPSFAHTDWNPQGVTSSVEAALGGYSGPAATVVSWYRPDSGATPPTTTATGSRLTFINKPLTQQNTDYRRVLLVKPIILPDGKLSVENVSSHAGGVAWYGNYLYVSQAQRINVFDIRHFYSLYADDVATIGRTADRINAHAYPYVMFQVAEFSRADCSWSPQTATQGLCTSGVSIDPTNNTLVSFEHRIAADMNAAVTGARIVSWPLDTTVGSPTRGLLQVSGSTVSSVSTYYHTPTPNLQGVVRNGSHIWMSRSKPTEEGMIYHTTTAVGASVQRTRPWLPHAEDIAYTQAVVDGVTKGRLWGVNETIGKRWLVWVYTDEVS